MENIQSDELTVNAPMSEMLTAEEIAEYWSAENWAALEPEKHHADYSFLGRRSIDSFNHEEVTE